MMVEVVGGKFILDDGSYGIASDIVQPGAWHIRLSGAARLASPRMTISFRQHGVIARLPVIGRRLPDEAFEEFSEI